MSTPAMSSANLYPPPPTQILRPAFLAYAVVPETTRSSASPAITNVKGGVWRYNAVLMSNSCMLAAAVIAQFITRLRAMVF